MFKPKLKESKLFIWRDIMDDRSRYLAKQAVLRVLLGSALMVAVPYAIGFYVDGLTNQVMDALYVGGILFFGLEAGRIIMNRWQQHIREYYFQHSFWQTVHALTSMYFNRPLSWLSGDTTQINGGGVQSLKNKIDNVSNSYIFQIIPGYCVVIFSLIACAYANVYLGLIALSYVFYETYENKKVSLVIHERMKPVVDAYRRWDKWLQECWRSVDHVKSQGVETKILSQIKSEIQSALKQDDTIWRVFYANKLVYHRLRSLFFALCLYSLVGYLVFNNVIPLAQAILVFFSFQRIRITLSDLNDQNREVLAALAGVEKYRKVLLKPVPFLYNEGIDFTEEDISFKLNNVSHYVTDGKERKLILRDVNVEIAAGEKVGIVGPSGAGKSQLVSLLERAADPTSGKVEVSGIDIRSLKLESYLRYCGMIKQKSEPFENSLLGNLLFGVSHLDLPIPYNEMDEVNQVPIRDKAHLALMKAGLEPKTFPEGIDTWIGEKGTKLSGGQQQRLQIAAAHMKLMMSSGPSLIIAYEPTASLDSMSELTVMEHLQDNLPAETTSIMIAHRLSTVKNCDKIIFVRPQEECGDEPQVREYQSLKELYEAMPLFREMADAQGFRP